MGIKIGDKIPDFVLKDQDKNEVKLSDFKGKKVLLSFHPLAWTAVCADQMKALEDNMETFNQLNTVPLGLSIDQLFSKSAWAKELDIKNLRVLADFWPHGGVAKRLGLLREKEGISERANVIIDEDGKVVFIKIYDIPELPNITEIIDFLNK